MNIFAIDQDPKQSARWLCDKHVIKMIVESSQILANCFTLETLAKPDCPRTITGAARKHFNPKHPSCLWANESSENMNWLFEHVKEMLREKYARFPDAGRHFCHDFIDWAEINKKQSITPKGKLTKFKIAISDKMNCRHHPLFNEDDPVLCYRLYYKLDKPFAKWKRNMPLWMNG